MEPLILAILGGLGLVFVFTDTGQTQADRMSESFGVPRNWFDVVAVHQYARFGRGVRMIGLALGGLVGFGLSASFSVRETSVVQRCIPARGFDDVSAGNSGSDTTSALRITPARDQRTTLPASQSLPPTTKAPQRVPADRIGRLGQAIENPRNTISCPDGTAVSTSSRTKAERLSRRQSGALFFGGLVGFCLASVLAERKAPRLIRRADVPFVDTWKRTGRSNAWRTGVGALALVQMFGLLETGSSGVILSVLGLILVVGFALVIGGIGSRKQHSVEEHTFSPMYRRTLSDYVPRRAVLGWGFSFFATVLVSIWVLGTGQVGTERSYLSSVPEFWVMVSAAVFSQIVAACSSVVIVRFRASFHDSDARALIADDARRAAAVQRILGASVCLATSTLSKLMNREVSFGWIGFFLFLVSLFGAVLWWSPIGVSKSTAERWKTLVRSTPSPQSSESANLALVQLERRSVGSF